MFYSRKRTKREPPGLVVWTAAALVLVAVAVVAGRMGAGDDGRGGDEAQVTWAEFSAQRRPPATWRPYAPSSPFNQRLPANPAVDPDSPAIVASLAADGPIASIKAIDGSPASRAEDFSRPFYYGRPSDPAYTIRCTQFGGRCPVAGQTVHIPSQAQPAGGTDSHMTVLDTETGEEWSFFAVESKPPHGGELVVGWGARIPIDGDGLEGGGGAAEFGGMAGRIRYEELERAVARRSFLPHALFMTVKCTRPGAYVAPATKGEEKGDCSWLPHPPEMGRRFWLDMTDAEIDRIPGPEWRRVIARTMARYGAFVGDIGVWGLQFESGMSYVSFGQANPFVTYARKHPEGTIAENGVTYFQIRDGIPWLERLRALEPSATAPAT